MILRIMMAVAFACGGAAAHDWRAGLDEKPGRFAAPRALKAEYDFGWSGVKAAEAGVQFSSKAGSHLLQLQARTVGVPRTLWKMDVTAVSEVARTTLRPIRLLQSEQYTRKKFTTRVDFSAEGAARLKQPDPPDAIPAKVKRFKLAGVQDLHSAFLLLRSRPLKQGEMIRMVVYPASSAYLAEVTVTARERIHVAGREWPAIRCDLKLRTVEKDYRLAEHKKFKRATAWLSDDRDRLLLKVDAEVFIGSVWAELKSVQFIR